MKLVISCLVCIILHTNIVFSQLEECPPEGIVQLPHPDCTLYYLCINGGRLEAECPRPLYYNPRTEHCDFPENVPECIGGTRPPVNGTTTEPTSTTSEDPPTEEPTLEPTTTPEPPSNTLTECGQTIIADSGFIEYKLNQNYNSGELCAFIIRLDKFYGCYFTLETTGINNSSSDTLTIIRIGDDQDTLQSVKLEATNSSVFLHYATYVVVFKTESSIGTGFRLRFESHLERVTKVPGIPMVFNNQTKVPLQFPLITNSTAGESEWDPIVVTSGAKLITEPESTFQLMVYDFFVNPGCASWYNIHSFDGTTTKFEGRICGLNSGGKKALAFNTKGLFIIVFYKSLTATEDYLGSIEWFKTTSSLM